MGTTFIAREKCGCIVGAVADEPHCTDEIVYFLHEGLRVEAVTDDWFREHWLEKCEAHQNTQLVLPLTEEA